MARHSTKAEASADELRAIEAVALDYVEGYLTGDAERHARCYHPEAVKRRFVEDEESGVTVIEVISPQVMVDYAATGLSVDTSAEYEVIVDSVDEDIASVRVYSTSWVDLLHIVKARGRWGIIHASWNRRTNPPQTANG